ncbi:hypothetical protein CBE37_05085 [bacterium TMED277]|nr:MAG: hypothetical protein CBE37_05085 [bacterium TMED277]
MIIKWLSLVISVLIMWITIMALVMRLSDAVTSALVLFPPKGFIKELPDGFAVLGYSNITLTIASDTNDFGAKLYDSGAWLVLPAGLKGCLSLR